jgi:hypothetical protein
MWGLYDPNNEGIAIQTTYGKLKSQFEEFFKIHQIGIALWGIARVNYIDSFEHNLVKMGEGLPNTYQPFMLKNNSYDYEKEVRALVISEQTYEIAPQGFTVRIDTSKLINSIVINPYSLYENIIKVRILLQMHGMESILKDSLLARSSFYMRD